MGEREQLTPDEVSSPRPKPIFGQRELFPEGDDLPLFSGTPQEAVDSPFVPEDHSFKQQMFPEMPSIDYDRILDKDRHRRRRKKASPQEPISGTLFESGDPATGTLSITSQEEQAQRLREAVAAYHLDIEHLRQLAVAGAELHEALRTGDAPPELVHLVSLLSALLRPPPREQVTSPTMVAAMLMVEMGYLDQEQMRVICLDTKNRLQKIHLVYQGSLNASTIRIGELFKEPVRLNSASIVLAHNHPSGEPTPSPEDVLVTRQIIDAGNLLDIDVLDRAP